MVLGSRAAAGALGPVAVGSVLTTMVFAGGHISGGHYNPAVSFAVMVRGKLSLNEFASYAVVQLAAGTVGGLVARAVVGTTGCVAGTPWKIFVVESLFTFALAYVVLNVATARATAGNSYFGLAIGFTVLAGAIAVGGVSGGLFNPAVALGVEFVDALAWSNYWIYVAASMLGAGMAATAFLRVQPAETKEAAVGDRYASRRTVFAAATRIDSADGHH
jgi:aquaporin Z